MLNVFFVKIILSDNFVLVIPVFPGEKNMISRFPLPLQKKFNWQPVSCKNLSGREQISASRDFTVCIIRCVYRAELILGR